MDYLGTLVDVLDGFRDHGELPAIMAGHDGEFGVWRYRELADTATGIARSLVRAGIAREEPVAIIAPNSPEWIAAYFGIVAAGATAVPLDWHASPNDLGMMLERSGCRRVFTTGARLTDLPGTWREQAVAIYLFDQASTPSARHIHWKELTQGHDSASLPRIDADTRASLLFTSGTTGTPKAVPLCHKHIIANVAALLAERILRKGDRLLLPLPLHHAYPFTVGMLSTLASAATLVLPGGTTGPLIVQSARSAQVTVILGVPGLYSALLQAIESRISRRTRLKRLVFRRLLALAIWARRHLGIRIGRLLFADLHEGFGGHLRILACGGAKLEPDLAWKLEGLGWQVLSGYGLTETSPILTFNPPRRARLDSEGLPIPGVKLRIPRPSNEPFGEVLAFGPSVFSGYLDDSQANEAAFAEPGWFRTGDLGVLDDDGYLHIVGRANETLVLPGGKKVFPEGIEKHYLAIPFINELAVLQRDDRLVALVVPNAEAIRSRGASRVEGLLRDEIERASAKLRPHERLSDFAVTMEALPRTHLGKLKRHQLPALFDAAKAGRVERRQRPLSAEDSALLSRQEIKAVWDWLSARYQGRLLSPEMSPQLDLGVDSLQWIELTLELQDRFNIKLSEEAIGRILSIRDLLNEVARQQRPAPGTSPVQTVDLSRWLAPLSRSDMLFGRLLYAIGSAIARLMFHLQVRGKELIPSGRRIVLTPNHSSYLDPVVLAASFSWAELCNTYWVGWSHIMLRGPIMRAVSRAFRVLPIDPDRDPGEALDLVRLALQRKQRLVWFPEGRLSPTGEITKFLPGIALVLERTGALAVPVHISGTFQAMPRGRLFPRPHKVMVSFAEPISTSDLAASGLGADRQSRIADGLQRAVSRINP
jgi:long-chain acyl-CoA synthetase